MARIFFERAPSGFRTVRGEVVKKIQRSLKSQGFDPGDIDGVYGDRTERALIAYQQAMGIAVSGKVDEKSWGRLVAPQLPTIYDRCLQLTADFEGHGFSKLEGNFDGAGLTWGIIGFTLKNGEIQAILKEVQAQHPQLLDDAFGSLKAKLASVLAGSLAKQMQWAQDITIGRLGTKVLPEWAEAFSRLGDFPEVQVIQLNRVQRYWDIASGDANAFNLQSEIGVSLCFDIAVQNGGIDTTEAQRIRKKILESPPTTEQDCRVIIANVVAENSKPQWVEDVRRRKLTIATGRGEVHGTHYAIQSWGIDEAPLL